MRYRDQDTSLFAEPLLSELAQKEFSYRPARMVPVDDYTSACRHVWNDFASTIDEAYDFILFDGSLIHHPVNDMMRNYDIGAEYAASHVGALLASLGSRKRYIFYLKTNDVVCRLMKARAARGQKEPTAAQIEFWEKRYANDMKLLERIGEAHVIYDVSDDNWDQVLADIVHSLITETGRR